MVMSTSELILNPSLMKRGTFKAPLLFLREGAGGCVQYLKQEKVFGENK